MTKEDLEYLILKERHEHKNPIAVALNFQDWKILNIEIHQLQHIEEASSELLSALKFKGILLLLKQKGVPEFLYNDPGDVLRTEETIIKNNFNAQIIGKWDKS